MKRVLVAVLLAATSVMTGCGSSEEPGLTESEVRLKSGESLDDAQRCGVDLPQCPSGLSCLVVDLEGKPAEALCLEDQSICARTLCIAGTMCAVMESYPARVACLGTGQSPDGDDSVSSP